MIKKNTTQVPGTVQYVMAYSGAGRDPPGDPRAVAVRIPRKPTKFVGIAHNKAATRDGPTVFHCISPVLCPTGNV